MKIDQNGAGEATLRLSIAVKVAVGVLTGLLISAIVGNIAMFRTIGILEARQMALDQASARALIVAEKVREDYVSRAEFAATVQPIQNTLGRIEGKVDALSVRRNP